MANGSAFQPRRRAVLAPSGLPVLRPGRGCGRRSISPRGVRLGLRRRWRRRRHRRHPDPRRHRRQQQGHPRRAPPVKNADIARCFQPLRAAALLGQRLRARSPALAESVEPSADAKTWTIKLRQGVTFHNGKDVTPEDVLFTHPAGGRPEGADLRRWRARADHRLRRHQEGRRLDARQSRSRRRTPSSTTSSRSTPSASSPPTSTRRTPSAPAPFKYKSFTPGKNSIFTKYDDYWGDKAKRRRAPDPGLRRRQRPGQRAPGRPDPDDRQPALQPDRHGQGPGRQGPRGRVRRLGAVHDAGRPEAVHRRAGPPGDAADLRPPADDRPGAERLRPPRQRPLRPVRPGLRQGPAAARAGHRPGQVAAQGGRRRRASRSSCSPATTSARWPRPPRPCSSQQAKKAGRRRQGGQEEPLLRRRLPLLPLRARTSGTPATTSRRPPSASLKGGTYNETHWDNAKFDRGLVTAAAARGRRGQAQRAPPGRPGDRVRRGRLHHLGLPQPGRRVSPQRPGSRAEQVPAAGLLQVQEGLRLGLSHGRRRRDTSRIRSRRSRRRKGRHGAAAWASGSRAGSGWPLLTLWLVSILVFVATAALGDPVRAILGKDYDSNKARVDRADRAAQPRRVAGHALLRLARRPAHR